MSKMSYYDMNKCLCKELCCEFEKFENCPDEKILHGIHKLIESMVGLTELEAAGAMREYLEDEHGYDSRSGEFRNRLWDRKPTPYYPIYNAARAYPMTQEGAYPYTYPGMPYNEGYMSEDAYNAVRSRDSRGRYNDGRYNDGREMMNGRNMDGRDGYGVWNHADPSKMKKKLSEQEIKMWMENLESESGERGPMWTKEEVESVAKKEGITFDKFSPETLYAAANMIYSDYCSTGEKFNLDKPSFYISLAKDFLVDPDSAFGEDGGDKKLAAYYEYIAEH